MDNDELCYLSASQAMALFHDGKLSPVELLEAVIARYEAVALEELGEDCARWLATGEQPA